MNRRTFLSASAAAAMATALPQSAVADSPLTESPLPPLEHRLPATDLDGELAASYIEASPIPAYQWAPESAVEAFKDIKFGLRIHWGIYSIFGKPSESWPFLELTPDQRQSYNQEYKTWNPAAFDADAWMNLCQESGMKMFAFTSKHHEGFCLFHTQTRVRQRTHWTAPGGPAIESCNLAYSIAETPFRRDVVRELIDAAHKRGIKIDLYFSHSDWYDADFRPYGWHPLQVPSAKQLLGWQNPIPGAQPVVDAMNKRFAPHLAQAPDPTPEQEKRMVERHRTQLTELLTRYGTIDMMCLDEFWGPHMWPHMRETILKVRELQPNVMLRARGIRNYGDYYTPEGFVPASKEATRMPWFVIYPLGSSFSYDPDAAKYKGTGWIVTNLVDIVAKGGNFMVGVGPDAHGSFHPTAQEQLRAAGDWLKVNGEGIYSTRPRPGVLWAEGPKLRFTCSKDGRTVYCFTTEWPGNSLAIRSLERQPAGIVEMLGVPGQQLSTRWDSATGLTIEIPENLQQESNRPCQHAWGFKIAAKLS